MDRVGIIHQTIPVDLFWVLLQVRHRCGIAGQSLAVQFGVVDKDVFHGFNCLLNEF
jgi:hypothetical protein